jgi:hypothetical protein
MNDYVLGKGKVYFDVFDANGNTTGQRFLGNCPGFTVQVASENLEHFSSTGGVKEKDLEVLIQVDRTATISCDNMEMANLELFLVGALTTITESAANITDEALTVLQDRTYQLGVSNSAPTGVRAVENVVVTNVGGATTHVLDTDYSVDLALGTITILAGGAIASSAAEAIEVDYDTTANSHEQIATATKSVKGALRYVADNPQGTNKDLYAPSAILSPEGDLSLIGEELGTIGFNVAFNKRDSSTAVVYLDGRAA